MKTFRLANPSLPTLPPMPRTFLYAAMWISAGVVGTAAVLYAELIAKLQTRFLEVFAEFPIWVTIACPFIFVLATWVVRFFAPDARGSGIPEVLAAIDKAKEHQGEDSVWDSRFSPFHRQAYHAHSALSLLSQKTS